MCLKILLKFLSGCGDQLVEMFFQTGVRAAQSVDDALTPIYIFEPSLLRPAIGRIFRNVADVADFIAEFDEFRAQRHMRRVFDLQFFARRFRQRFIVGNFHHHFSSVRAEFFFNFGFGRLRIFHRVVQHGGD